MKNAQFKNIAGKTVFGFTDAVNECDCCGKTGLKGTYCCELEEGRIVHFGSVCVYKNTGLSKKQVKQEIDYTVKFATNERYNELKANARLQSLKQSAEKRKRQVIADGGSCWFDNELKDLHNEIHQLEEEIYEKHPMAPRNGTLCWYGLPNSPKHL